MSRISNRFAALKAEGRTALIPFIMAGDPDAGTTAALLQALPDAGADLIEIGMPFTDPMADGPAIQAAGLRALAGGMTLKGVLDLVAGVRVQDQTTPIILMGYFNPIYSYGVDAFLAAAKAAGVDGLIIVDLPPEEDAELCLPARAAGIDFIRLATPTTDAVRLPTLLQNAGGFLYYVSIAGITGTKSAVQGSVEDAITRFRASTDLPIAVGFGITTAEDAARTAKIADAVVVGSAITRRSEAALDGAGKATPNLVPDVLAFVRDLSAAVRSNRR
jgi:tryptophan synthase alpha chain